MTNREFMYWLQGYFELTDAEALPKDFEKKVKAHIELTRLCDKKPNPVLKANVALIETFLDDKNYTALKQTLSNSFVHAIDGDYNVDQAVANEVHSGEKPPKPPSKPPSKPPKPSPNYHHSMVARC